MSKKLPRTHLDNPYQDRNITVHFIGDVTCNKFHEIKYHKNPGYEICLINKGKGIFKIKNQGFPIKRGQLFITKPPETHAGWPAKEDPYRILYLCFSINNSCSSPWLNYRKKLDGLQERVTYDKPSQEKIFFSLFYEIINSNLFKESIIKSLLEQYVIFTIRNYYQQDLQKKLTKQSKPDNLLAAKIMYFIENNIFENINLELISKHLNYSVSHLSRVFKKETGFSIIEYYNIARLEKSKEYLIKDHKTITNIAKKLGYNSIHHYSNAFKQLYDLSPTDFKNNNIHNKTK